MEKENHIKAGEYIMSNVFLVSDTHFGHSNILSFLKSDGSKLRDFSNIEEHDEFLVKQWNSVVSKNSRIYHLGDVCFSKKVLPILNRLNGRKVLIKGNHDKLDLKEYLPYFDDIRGSHQFDGMLLTHIPVHHESLARWGLNVHGHLHSNKVLDNYGRPDKRYKCVSMEQLDNYTPVSLEEIKCLIP